MEELVSVIIPLYNSELYVYETINSVIEQTYKHIEIIVIDDGSSDNSAEVVKKIIKDHNEMDIKYYYQANGGVSVARNNGIKKASGKYIAFLDSDDLWCKTKLENQIEILNKVNGKVCYCGYSQLIEASNIIKKEKIKFIEGNILISILKERTGGCTSTWVINKEVILNNNIWFTENCNWGEDTEFYIKICSIAEVCYAKDYLVFYRVRENSLTSGNSQIKKIDEISIWIRLDKWFKDNQDKLICKDMSKFENLIYGFRIPNSISKHLYTMLKGSANNEIKNNFYEIQKKLDSEYLKKFKFNNGMKSISVFIKLLLIRYKMYKNRVV
jgi:glycosyltransferase involved in cell wall biosynthesis